MTLSLDEVAGLAAACRAADGGLPFAASVGFLRSRWAAEGSAGRGEWDAAGKLVAAVSVRPGPVVSVLGASADLLDWALESAASPSEATRSPVTVETESLSAAQESLFASRGLRQVFAEDVMRIDLTDPVPPPVWPAGITLEGWSGPRFFAVYEAAFRERPGFPGRSADEWISGVSEEDDFRPAWSVLAVHQELGDAGFVVALDAWIDQVGVAPAARGLGLGAALVRETLTRMRAGGCAEAWLAVNVDNVAGRLYARLGFTAEGRRARFRI